ncbi:hypothetical protein KBZ18_12795 [Synechococcus sp. Cruz-9H2]|uniref:class I SAM-dependent methyltransferase n=1 Tax=unclassified Synechococcus TaxID=2626047 RepID=UPI0020CBC342|nr:MULTISPECIES: class I SAM-dependent methyltransferase [unclassified Synechococcus]MCP9820362.1 hypothetical protein [Synechococcus sp. Cruz-9H2]MCP9844670.1 hypothetical protein [Synechococcus sp. Edmonson 11F2]MCP9856792.1 hypothetical protein [Synechococcus sp. Cruz-9C9]MCP9863998.1 hypothetical protein [Synechococcus sp. Cruz-7E5]MCP9871193.1 hypothetical protein [Synechococcus sp. Cruz-7B9]
MKLYALWQKGLLPTASKRLHGLVDNWLPPAAKRLIQLTLSEWEYLPNGWPHRIGRDQGWNVTSVAVAQENHWQTLHRNLQGPGPLGVSHFLRSDGREHTGDHNAMMSFGYVLAKAARYKQKLSILDWGGSLGHFYLYSRALLPDLDIDYTCFDVSLLNEAGRRVLPQVSHLNDPAAALSRQYDLVISSSALHYFKEWESCARQLAAATLDSLYLARLQTVRNGRTYAVIQRPYHSGYDTEYPSWFISRRDLLACFEGTGLELEREFVYAEDWVVRGAPERGHCHGFLYRRQPS